MDRKKGRRGGVEARETLEREESGQGERVRDVHEGRSHSGAP